MTDEDPFGPGPGGGQGKQPWFGPRRYGYGYVPRTWQGYLLSALCVAFIVILATIFGGHSPVMAIGIIPFIIILVVARTQGRR
jgi:hypothetical protein